MTMAEADLARLSVSAQAAAEHLCQVLAQGGAPDAGRLEAAMAALIAAAADAPPELAERHLLAALSGLTGLRELLERERQAQQTAIQRGAVASRAGTAYGAAAAGWHP